MPVDGSVRCSGNGDLNFFFESCDVPPAPHVIWVITDFPETPYSRFNKLLIIGIKFRSRRIRALFQGNRGILPMPNSIIPFRFGPRPEQIRRLRHIDVGNSITEPEGTPGGAFIITADCIARQGKSAYASFPSIHSIHITHCRRLPCTAGCFCFPVLRLP